MLYEKNWEKIHIYYSSSRTMPKQTDEYLRVTDVWSLARIFIIRWTGPKHNFI